LLPVSYNCHDIGIIHTIVCIFGLIFEMWSYLHYVTLLCFAYQTAIAIWLNCVYTCVCVNNSERRRNHDKMPNHCVSLQCTHMYYFSTCKKSEWLAAYTYVTFHIQELLFVSFHITFWFTGYIVLTQQFSLRWTSSIQTKWKIWNALERFCERTFYLTNVTNQSFEELDSGCCHITNLHDE